MKYSVAVLSVVVAAVAAEKPHFLNSDLNVEDGKPFELKFDGCEEGCTIALKVGDDPLNLKTVRELTASAKGGSYEAHLPEDLPKGKYSFYIKNNSDGLDNYSDPFPYGSGDAKSSAATSSEATSTESSSATKTSATKSETETETATETASETATSSMTKSSATESKTSAAPTSTTSEASKTSATAKPSDTDVPDNGAGRLSSPIALVAGAIAAMVYFS